MSTNEPVLLQGMEILPDFVMLDIVAESNIDAVAQLAQNLQSKGAVKPGFVPAIIKREEEFCTGLAFEEMGIAIPHTDADHVNSPCIAVGVLDKPVTFQSMGMPDVPCEVEMLIMLGITSPHTQLDFLKTLMQVFQTPGRLKLLKESTSREALVETFKSFFI